jgi:hypothetical protein
MPQGRYRVLGDRGEPIGTEDFRCAPGPMGWRYVSEISTDEHGPHHAVMDIAVDASWRIVRARIETPAHRLLLEPRGDSIVGERDGEPLELPWGQDTHLDYLTPATNLITCHRLGASDEIDVVFIDPYSLEPRGERQRYDLLGSDEVDTPVGRFAADRWRYTALDSGWTSLLWVADDVVVRYDAIFELIDYEPGASGPAPLV